jgi:O-antigen ligase
MAAETLTAPRLTFGARYGDWPAEAGYLAFLLLIFVSLSPFAIRDPVTLAAGESGFAGSGDVLRQFSFLAVFAWIGISTFRQQGAVALPGVPTMFAVLLAWCLLSALWAAEPDVSFRRAVLAAVIVVSATMSVSAVGPERALVLFRYVLAGVLIVNWISIPLVPQAVHLPGEADPGLVGDWRGIFFHKNIAGSVTAITAILYFFSTFQSRRAVDFMLFAAATIFVVMTHSKSSLGLLPVALVLGLIYRLAWRRGIDRFMVGAVVGLIAVAGLAAAIADWAVIAHVFDDPAQFTGRAAIWQGEIAFIVDHPLLGSGFGTFADTGALSPLHNYVGDAWVRHVSHGHNAYLQLFVTIGGIGFLLSVAALVIAPLMKFLRENGSAIGIKTPLFAVFAFMIFHNMLESDFLEGDSPAWVAFVLILAMLNGAWTAKPAIEAVR